MCRRCAEHAGPELPLFRIGILIAGGVTYFAILWWVQWINAAEHNFTLMDILRWSQHVETSAAQIQKSYDWKITQWSGLGSAILTATLGFVSAVVVEVLKGTKVLTKADFVLIVVTGAAALLAAYAFTHFQVSALNTEFLRLYNLLALLRSG
jgi:hypothetical protein